MTAKDYANKTHHKFEYESIHYTAYNCDEIKSVPRIFEEVLNINRREITMLWQINDVKSIKRILN